MIHPYTKFEVRRPCRSEDMVHDVLLLLLLLLLLLFFTFIIIIIIIIIIKNVKIRVTLSCVSALKGLVILTFDRWTLKLVCESNLRWETFLPNLDTLGFGFWNYSLCTRQTDRRTDKNNAYAPFTTGGA